MSPFWDRHTRALSYLRLKEAIPVFEVDLKATKQRASPAIGVYPRPFWEVCATSLLDEAKKALEKGDFQLGWGCLKAAERYRIYGLTQKELEAKAAAIAREAADANKKVTPWRKESIAELLSNKNRPASPCAPCTPCTIEYDRDSVFRAAQILDEHIDNGYIKLGILRSRLVWLAIASVIALLGWLWLAPSVPHLALVTASPASEDATPLTVTVPLTLTIPLTLTVPLPITDSEPSSEVAIDSALERADDDAVTEGDGITDTQRSVVFLAVEASALPVTASTVITGVVSTQVDDPVRSTPAMVRREFWFTIMLAGILGALISAFTLSLSPDSAQTRIPAELASWMIALARLAFAALTAVVVSLFLLSGILTFVNLSYELLLAAAVASGFSDRLLLAGIGRLSP